jgi:type II secretory pathway pseudopilin PulG
MSAQKNIRALTLVELLIVIAIIIVLLLPLLITYRTSRASQALRASTEQLADDIRTAHIYARESKDKKAWGIKKLGSDSYALVSGTDTTSVISQNFHLEPGITFTNDFIIWFGSGTGETLLDSSVMLQNLNGKKMEVVVIKSGAVEVKTINE